MSRAFADLRSGISRSRARGQSAVFLFLFALALTASIIQIVVARDNAEKLDASQREIQRQQALLQSFQGLLLRLGYDCPLDGGACYAPASPGAAPGQPHFLPPGNACCEVTQQ